MSIALYAILWVLVVLQGFILLALIYRLAELRRLVELHPAAPAATRFPVGSFFPDFSGTDLFSRRLLLGNALKGRHHVVLFVSAECTSCRELARGLADQSANVGGGLVVFCRADETSCRDALGFLANSGIPVLVSDSAALQVSDMPVAIMLDLNLQVVGIRYPSYASQVIGYLMRMVPNSSDVFPLEAT